MITVKEIVKKYLEDNGYDGLFSEYECGCLNDDLILCQDDCLNCKPGYRCVGDDDYDYYVKAEKENIV